MVKPSIPVRFLSLSQACRKALSATGKTASGCRLLIDLRHSSANGVSGTQRDLPFFVRCKNIREKNNKLEKEFSEEKYINQKETPVKKGKTTRSLNPLSIINRFKNDK